MEPPSVGRKSLSFGLFDADLNSHELHKSGHLVHLQDQPFRILAMLLERPGEVVSREEIRQKLWPDGTFVDFDEGIDTALKKLRQALGDSRGNPVFIETLPRRGYRFLAPVREAESTGENQETKPAAAETGGEGLAAETERSTSRIARARLRRNAAIAGVSIAGMIGASLLISSFSQTSAPSISRILQITHSDRLDPWGGITTDGARIFFLERDADHWNVMQAPVSGGEAQPFSSPFPNTRVFGISPEISEFVVAPFTQRGPGLEFWTLPVVGGAPRRLGNTLGDSAAFSPNGTRIAYSTADGIYTCDRAGTDVQKLLSLPGPAWYLTWSPDGKVLRFTEMNQKSGTGSIWEVSSEGQDLHAVLPEMNQPSSQIDGRWSPDGRYFFFLSCEPQICSVWVRREKGGFPYLSRHGPLVRLTSEPMSFDLLAPSQDGRRLFVTSGSARMELVQQDGDTKQFVTLLKGAQVSGVSFSPQGDQVAVTLGDGNLWQNRTDGTQRVQLTAEFNQIFDSRWSPDGTSIVFSAAKQGRGLNLYQVRAGIGAAERLLPDDGVYVYPDWSPDGESIVYSARGDTSASPPTAGSIYVLDLKTRERTKVLGSDGLEFPRWSPDGKYLAALTERDEKKLMLFNFETREWKQVAHGNMISQPTWSRDAAYLYFEDLLEAKEPVYRVRPDGSALERWMDFDSLLQSGAVRCQFAGLTPEGSILAIINRGGNDIYALDLNLP